MIKTIYKGHYKGKFMYSNLIKFMIKLKKSGVEIGFGGRLRTTRYYHQVYHIEGVTVDYIVDKQVIGKLTKLDLIATGEDAENKIGEVEKIILGKV